MKKPFLVIENLVYQYPGESHPTINQFSEQVGEGEIIGVIGKNGVGKSTLMKVLSSFFKPFKGKVNLGGYDSADLTHRKDYIEQMIYLSHDMVILSDMKINEYFRLYSCLYSNYSIDLERKLLDEFGFKGDELISILSTGNRLKVYFLFALAAQVKLVIVDEITAVMDPENREIFLELVQSYAKNGVSFIIATNIVEDLEGHVDRVWLIQNGNVSEASAVDLKSHFKRKAA